MGVVRPTGLEPVASCSGAKMRKTGFSGPKSLAVTKPDRLPELLALNQVFLCSDMPVTDRSHALVHAARQQRFTSRLRRGPLTRRCEHRRPLMHTRFNLLRFV